MLTRDMEELRNEILINRKQVEDLRADVADLLAAWKTSATMLGFMKKVIQLLVLVSGGWYILTHFGQKA